ncbi:MAG: hypothetical protein AAF802_33035, partial [Planctomycetota bacterium]
MIVSVAAIGLLAVLISLMLWTRSRRRRAVGIVELFRLLLISFALLLLFRPESTRSVSSQNPTDLLVIVDDSRSMSTPDASAGHSLVPRRQLIRKIIDDPAWSQLSPRYEMTQITADDEDLGAEIAAALQSVPQATSVVLLSDGDLQNLAVPRRAIGNWMAGHAFRSKLHGVAVGQSTPLPDVALTSAVIPSVAAPNKKLQVPFRIDNRMPKATNLLVSALIDGELVDQRSYDTLETGSISDSFSVAFDRLG